ISRQSFWNADRTLIFTNNTVEVYKILKGTIASSTVEVVTVGGSVDGTSMVASDLLELEIGKTGIFFCHNNNAGMRSPSSGKMLYDVYASSQGFLEYDMTMQLASAPFAKNQNVREILYPQIEKLSGTHAVVKKELPVANNQNRLFAPGNITFSPTTVNAGALLDPATNLLTISGTDFGNPAGSAAVFFDNANDGSGGSFTGLAYNSPLIVSWSNTQIQVRVPTLAGTGLIAVRDEFGATVMSADELNVNYAIITSAFSATAIKETNQMNANGSGGYSVLYSTSSANGGVDFNSVPAAKAAFQRALNTWNEVAGWNVTEGGNTTSQAVANDGVNIVMFDNTATGVAVLPDGVLGTCFSFSSMCLPLATNQGQLTGFDIVLRNEPVSAGTAAFVSGPCPPAATDFTALDLETVILHELGHAVGLAHVNFNYEGTVLPQINPGLLMNFALVN
ncbi:MAG TPA: hypothetical protein VEB42_11300, partial [Chitinophagaceae bacterium]|nr:hypothetical protein [Chitinophagaceae bacterium]